MQMLHYFMCCNITDMHTRTQGATGEVQTLHIAIHVAIQDIKHTRATSVLQYNKGSEQTASQCKQYIQYTTVQYSTVQKEQTCLYTTCMGVHKRNTTPLLHLI